jgi:chemotaxis signal transduction protein
VSTDQSPESVVAQVLEERARALAAPLSHDDEVETIGVLVVEVGKERYALGLGHVLSIETSRELTPVPGVPSFWTGITNISGTVYPILNLGEYLGIGATVAEDKRTIVLVSGGGLEVALLVDRVADVNWIRRDAIGPPPNTGGRRVVEGVTAELVAMLDLDTLVADPALVIDEEAD